MTKKETTENGYRLMLESIPVMVWRSGVNGDYNYFNQAWLKFCGRPLDADSGRSWTEDIHEQDRERRISIFNEALSGKDSFGIQFRLLRHDGEYRWVYERGVPCYDDAGVFTGFVGSCVDISERIELEEELQSAHITEAMKLRGLLPICAACKNIRNDEGYWQSVEMYIMEHSAADFTHSLCPGCRDRLYPGLKSRK